MDSCHSQPKYRRHLIVPQIGERRRPLVKARAYLALALGFGLLILTVVSVGCSVDGLDESEVQEPTHTSSPTAAPATPVQGTPLPSTPPPSTPAPTAPGPDEASAGTTVPLNFPAAAPTTELTTSLLITNESGVDIGHIYLAPSYSDKWGDDLLGDTVLANGESVALAGIPSGTYDVTAESSDHVTISHVTISIEYEQVFDRLKTWEVMSGDGRFLPRLDQWAFAATASSEFSSDGGSAGQAEGEPDTDACVKSPTAWASSASNGVDWLELEYPLPVIPRRINVYESHSPGFIVGVEVADDGNQYHTVWEGGPSPAAECPRVFSFLVTGIDLPVATVRIHVDQREGGNWNQIDAVELVGIDQ